MKRLSGHSAAYAHRCVDPCFRRVSGNWMDVAPLTLDPGRSLSSGRPRPDPGAGVTAVNFTRRGDPPYSRLPRAPGAGN
jgi:hypothetical protein